METLFLFLSSGSHCCFTHALGRPFIMTCWFLLLSIKLRFNMHPSTDYVLALALSSLCKISLQTLFSKFSTISQSMMIVWHVVNEIEKLYKRKELIRMYQIKHMTTTVTFCLVALKQVQK